MFLKKINDKLNKEIFSCNVWNIFLIFFIVIFCLYENKPNITIKKQKITLEIIKKMDIINNVFFE